MHKVMKVLYLMYPSRPWQKKEKRRNPHIVWPNIHWNMEGGWWWHVWKCDDEVLYLYGYDGQTKPMFNVLSFFFLCSVVLPFLLAMIIQSVFPSKKKKKKIKTLSSCWEYMLRWLSILFKLEFHLHSTFTPSSFIKVFFSF